MADRKNAHNDYQKPVRYYYDVTEESNEDTPRCAITCLQRYTSLLAFVAMAGGFGFMQFAILAYASSVMPSVENQFGLSGNRSDYFQHGYDIAYVIITPIVAHFARFSNKPRVLGVSAFVAAVCGVLAVVPSLLNEPSVVVIVANTSVLEEPALCGQDALNGNLSSAVDSLHSAGDAFDVRGFALILAGTVILAVGCAPVTSLCLTYMEDNANEGSSPMYMAIFEAARLAGPIFGYTLGRLCSRLYFDLQETYLTAADDRWVGAWWLGFCISPLPLLVLGILFFSFPRRLKEPEMDEELRPETSYKAGQFKDFFRSLGRLFRNVAYLCIVCGASSFFYVISGLYAFMPQYMESQFRQPGWMTHLSIGLAGPFMGIVGVLIGGLLVTRMKLTALSCMLFVIIVSGTGTIILAVMMNVTCPQTLVAGTWTDGRLSLNESCNSNCSCPKATLHAVCGADGYTYFSPCHAACTGPSQNGTYSDCGCVNASSAEVTEGFCRAGCHMFYPYVVLTAAGTICAAMTVVPIYAIIFKMVRIADKTLAVGMYSAVTVLLSFIPGPIIFGLLADSSCILPITSGYTSSRAGNCWLYAQNDMRLKLHGVTLAFCMLGMFLYLIAIVKISQRDSSAKERMRKMADPNHVDDCSLVEEISL